MKILHVVGQLSLGGTEKTAILFCKYLAKMGHEVRLFAFAGGERQEQANRTCKTYVGQLADFDECLWGFDPDIVHFHRGGWAEDERVERVLPVLKEGGHIVETNIFGDVDRGKYSDKISASYFVSNYIRNWFMLGVQPGDAVERALRVVYNPIEKCDEIQQYRDLGRSDFAERFGIPTNHVIAGRIGRSENLDGISVMAIRDIWEERSHIDPECFHVVALAPPQRMIDVLGSYPNFHSFDYLVDDHDIEIFYGGIDLLLHDREDGETFGCGIAEAMMRRVPVVSHVSNKYQAQFEIMGADPDIIPQLAMMKPENIKIKDRVKIVPGGFIVGHHCHQDYVEGIEMAFLGDRYDPFAAQDQAMKFEAEGVVKTLVEEYQKL